MPQQGPAGTVRQGVIEEDHPGEILPLSQKGVDMSIGHGLQGIIDG
jgi:hypothetical protein